MIVLAFAVALAVSAPAQEWKGRARIDGQVTDEDGSGLSGATVSLHTPEGGAGPEVASGRDGRFVIDGVAAGSWVLEVTAPDYRARIIGVHLPDDSSWLGPVDVRLEKLRPEPEPRPVEAALPEKGATVEIAAPLDEAPDDPEVAAGFAPAGEPEAPVGYGAVRLALAAGRSDMARTLAASVLPGEPGSADLFVDIGHGFLLAGETDEAVVFFGRALDQEPGHVHARYERALGLLALGRLGEAREDLETVHELQPDGPLAEKAGQALEELAASPGESR